MYFYFTPCVGIVDVEAELQKNYRSFKLNTVCIRNESGVFRVVCFNKACPLLPFAKSLFMMTNTFDNGIFRSIWSNTLHQARAKNPNLSVKHLQSDVWTPAFQQCQKLLKDLYQLTITLQNVNKHFKNYSQDDLTREFTFLSHGVNTCTDCRQGEKWISQSVEKIVQYRKLCGYCSAAKSFLNLKDSLKLSGGDFTDVEMISKEVKILLFVRS